MPFGSSNALQYFGYARSHVITSPSGAWTNYDVS
jgi:hypothetical protein